MMKEYDIVILYEVKNREFENILLLKYELDKRGYNVGLIETWDSLERMKRPVKANVMISFSLYGDGTINFIRPFAYGYKKIINLQWEQIYTNGDANKIENGKDYIYGISGNAVNGAHISWGDVNYNRLVKSFRVPVSNVCKAGNINMDFLRPEFQGYYFTREDICHRYQLDKDKKIYLFISSFSYVDLPSNYKKSRLYQNVGFDINSFYSISNDSQVAILEWFEKELIQHSDIEVIYRPHPAEYGNKRLKDLSEKYKNFHVISDMSIKQWIVVADKIYTWWSTSIGEIYAAGKGCSVLRPISVPYESDIESYKDCDYITSFERFDKEYLSKPSFPISKDTMESYYFIDSEKPSYKYVADFVEKVYKSDDFIMDIRDTQDASDISILKSNIKAKLLRFIVTNNMVSRIFLIAGSIIGKDKRKSIDAQFEELRYAYKMADNNRYDPEEEKRIMDRISTVLDDSTE